MERILSSGAFTELLHEFGRDRVKAAATSHLDALRRSRSDYDETSAADSVRSLLATSTTSTLRHVINATGILIHTNLGRSPIDDAIWGAAQDVVTGYSNLEFDLENGERGARDEHLTQLCRSLFGCEAAVLTNNNAAGTLLLLAAVASGKEVIVSRGELVEIGGGFRVPDVIQQGGAKLREVGTTNRTRARDYAEAVSRKTGAILRVHRSNFDIVGFTEQPTIEELVEVAHAKKLPMLYDEGSGRVVDLAPYGFQRAHTIRELIDLGVDAITCSTDKLIGATQGGLILGRAAVVDRVRKHPLMRALRAGKESYAVIAETLRAFATGKHESLIGIYRMLSMSPEALRGRALDLAAGTSANIIDSTCALGGGTTPTETIPSLALAFPASAYEHFLRNDPPIVARVKDDRCTIDVRTLQERDLEAVRAAVARL